MVDLAITAGKPRAGGGMMLGSPNDPQKLTTAYGNQANT